jgi:hypothetical protein
MRSRRIVVLCLLVAAAPVLAQGAGHAHEGMAGMDHHPASPSATAARQIASVEQALLPLGAANAAQSAGFRPVLGWIPTMGVHWVNEPRMMQGRQFDMLAPSQLMFSKIGGRDSLVGAAYAYIASAADTTRPATFDGAPAWHEHADLAPPGMSLVMLHVWFVPSPDGPFAGTNPNLPYWALGLPAPDASRMRDPAFDSRVRRAALALAELIQPAGVFPTLGRRPDVIALMAPHRDSVRALLPELRAAMESKSRDRFDRVADRAAAQWDTMYAAYLGSARTAEGKRRAVQYAEMLLGQHGEH